MLISYLLPVAVAVVINLAAAVAEAALEIVFLQNPLVAVLHPKMY
jgi:hypothetical protein